MNKATMVAVLSINPNYYDRETLEILKNSTWGQVSAWIDVMETNHPDKVCFSYNVYDLDDMKNKKLASYDGDMMMIWFF